MNTRSANNHNQKQAAFGHAVVIGSSMAGLTAARVLIDHFERVTLIDRDRLPEGPEFRRGVPQAVHAHTLPLRGQKILEDQFPGLTTELRTQGAIPIEADNELAVFLAGSWHDLRHHSINSPAIVCSRPLLESTIYRRLAAHPRIEIIQEHDVIGLRSDNKAGRVTGVQLRSRQNASQPQTELAADLVLDASGRGSLAPEWLAGLGYLPPLESTINAFAGYASRIYRQPAEFAESWKTLYIKPAPPGGTRGGMIIPLEGDRWYVTLVGMARDYPATDEAGFLDFARSLPTSRLYEAIKDAEPLSKPCGFRRTEHRVRHYDRLPRYLEGFLVAGDAAYALNPVYAQGMTAAAMGSLALDHALKQQQNKAGSDLTGLAKSFQKQLSKAVAGTWAMGTREDQRWPATEVAENVVPRLKRAARRPVKPIPPKRTTRVATGVVLAQPRPVVIR
jgi:2-polyprenyl-6-methoxyphenol hydroxylase-like FAD-dependent oxidoreductase